MTAAVVQFEPKTVREQRVSWTIVYESEPSGIEHLERVVARDIWEALILGREQLALTLDKYPAFCQCRFKVVQIHRTMKSTT